MSNQCDNQFCVHAMVKLIGPGKRTLDIRSCNCFAEQFVQDVERLLQLGREGFLPLPAPYGGWVPELSSPTTESSPQSPASP